MRGDHLAILGNARELPQRAPARDLDIRAGTIELAIPRLRSAAMCVASRYSMGVAAEPTASAGRERPAWLAVTLGHPGTGAPRRFRRSVR